MSLNRRNFLRTLGLSSLTLGLNLQTTETRASISRKLSATDLSTIKVTGVVKSSGKGVAGVAVTDGVNVVVTDSRGNYTLTTNTTAEFVYISIPKGYAFTHENGVT